MSVEDEDEQPDKTLESDVSIQDQETTQISPKSVEAHCESEGSSQVSCKVENSSHTSETEKCSETATIQYPFLLPIC